MSETLYLGDEWTAVGYRLAGASTRRVSPEHAAVAFEQALARKPALLLLDAALAGALDPDRLEQARAALSPPVVVVSDASGRHTADSLTARVRRRMGVAQ